jgi:hypothetical protein
MKSGFVMLFCIGNYLVSIVIIMILILVMIPVVLMFPDIRNMRLMGPVYKTMKLKIFMYFPNLDLHEYTNGLSFIA